MEANKKFFKIYFGEVVDKITIVDNVNTSQNKQEKVINYVIGCCKLSIKCEKPLDQVQTIRSFVENIKNWIAFIPSSSDMRTFQNLIFQIKKI